jgi:hypothetical protein
MIKLKYMNTHDLMVRHVHDWHDKDLAVLHETISPDIIGWSDILNVERDLARRDYGIHGMTDVEGKVAWALDLGRAVFWQCGGVNERSIGIEQVSNIPALIASRRITNEQGRQMWAKRTKQLAATANLLVAWHNADPKNHPLKYSDGESPGITSHWDVSQHHSQSKGHWDCRPVHKGGHYPILAVVRLAVRTNETTKYRF